MSRREKKSRRTNFTHFSGMWMLLSSWWPEINISCPTIVIQFPIIYSFKPPSQPRNNRKRKALRTPIDNVFLNGLSCGPARPQAVSTMFLSAPRRTRERFKAVTSTRGPNNTQQRRIWFIWKGHPLYVVAAWCPGCQPATSSVYSAPDFFCHPHRISERTDVERRHGKELINHPKALYLGLRSVAWAGLQSEPRLDACQWQGYVVLVMIRNVYGLLLAPSPGGWLILYTLTVLAGGMTE